MLTKTQLRHPNFFDYSLYSRKQIFISGKQSSSSLTITFGTSIVSIATISRVSLCYKLYIYISVYTIRFWVCGKSTTQRTHCSIGKKAIDNEIYMICRERKTSVPNLFVVWQFFFSCRYVIFKKKCDSRVNVENCFGKLVKVISWKV